MVLEPFPLLHQLYRAAVDGAAPGAATRSAVSALDLRAPVHVIAIGKAARTMAAGAVDALTDRGVRIAGGVIVAPPEQESPNRERADTESGAAPTDVLRVVFGSHPIPDAASWAAARAIDDVVAGVHAGDDVIVLISGGSSSLAAAPSGEAPEVSEQDLAALYAGLLASGADIHLVNAVRKRFVRWSGGRLAAALAHAHVRCLAVSDVPGDDPGTIGSGPCVGDSVETPALLGTLRARGIWGYLPPFAQQHLDAIAQGRASEPPRVDDPRIREATTRVLVRNRDALEAAAAHARASGIDDVVVDTTPLTGEAAIAGVRMASDLIARRRRARGPRISRCVLWGGETTVTMGSRVPSADQPVGGRSQELALAAARSLADAGDHATGIALLAAGTDGRDGPTDAAGGIVDRNTWAAIGNAGRDPSTDLARHDAYRALDVAGALLRPGLTGTNVMDVAIGLIL